MKVQMKIFDFRASYVNPPLLEDNDIKQVFFKLDSAEILLGSAKYLNVRLRGLYGLDPFSYVIFG